MLSPKEQSRIVLDELGNRAVLFVPPGASDKVGKLLSSVRAGTAVANRAAVEPLEAALASAKIDEAAFRKAADARFERANCVENAPEIFGLWGYDGIASYWAGSKGAVTAYFRDGFAARIEALPYSASGELPAAARGLAGLATELGLSIVDVPEGRSASPEDAEAVGGLLARFEIHPDTPAPIPETRGRTVFRAFVAVVGFVGFAAFVSRGAKDPESFFAGVAGVLAVIAAYVLATVGALRVMGAKIRADEDGLRTFWFRKRGFVRYADAGFVIVKRRKDRQTSGFWLGEKGKLRRVAGNLSDTAYDAILRKLMDDRKLRKDRQFGLPPNLVREALRSPDVPFLLRVRRILSKIGIGKFGKADEFCLRYGEGGGYFADGIRLFEWSTFGRPRPVANPTYAKLAREALWEAGSATFGRYAVLVGESGRLYLARGEFLHRMAGDADAGMAAAASGARPEVSLSPYRGKSHPARFAGPSWEYDGGSAPPEIGKRALPEEGAPYGGRAVTVLVSDGETERATYDFDTGKTYAVRYAEAGEWSSAAEITPESREYLLGWRRYEFRILCPRPFADEFAERLREALGISGPPGPETRDSRSDTGPSLRYPATGETEAGFRRFVGNPDWHGFAGGFGENRLREAHAAISSLRERSEAAYATAYANAVAYSEAFPGNFFKPNATLGPVAPYLTEVSERAAGAGAGETWTGGAGSGTGAAMSEFSLTFLRKYGHEICFDLCSVLGIPADPERYSKATDNDGLPGAHCLAAYSKPETGEFVVADCQNADTEYGVVVRVSANLTPTIRRRVAEWDAFLRLQRGHSPSKEIRDEYGDPDSLFAKILADCRIGETELLNLDETVQYAYMGSLRHKFDVLRWRVGGYR